MMSMTSPGPRFLAGEAALHRFPVGMKGQVSIEIIHMEKISGSRIFGGKKNRFKPEQDDPLEITFAVSVGFCSAGEEIPQFCPEGRGAKQPERFFKVRVLRCYEESGVLCLYSFTVISVDLGTLVQVQERIPLGDGPGAV